MAAVVLSLWLPWVPISSHEWASGVDTLLAEDRTTSIYYDGIEDDQDVQFNYLYAKMTMLVVAAEMLALAAIAVMARFGRSWKRNRSLELLVALAAAVAVLPLATLIRWDATVGIGLWLFLVVAWLVAPGIVVLTRRRAATTGAPTATTPRRQ